MRKKVIKKLKKGTAAAAAKSLQSWLTLCDPRDGSPPGSPVPGILQVRTLEWVAMSFSNAWRWKVKVSLSRVQLLATPWTAAYQALPSMGFSRQEYWSGLLLPSPIRICILLLLPYQILPPFPFSLSTILHHSVGLWKEGFSISAQLVLLVLSEQILLKLTWTKRQS